MRHKMKDWIERVIGQRLCIVAIAFVALLVLIRPAGSPGSSNAMMLSQESLSFADLDPGAQPTEDVGKVDVAIVYDRSGSMQFETICFDCYEREGVDVYPEGTRFYLPFDETFCNSSDAPIVYNGYEILVAEAEYFAYSTSYSEHDYHRDHYVFPNTYWAMQRTPGSAASGQRYPGGFEDKRGAHMMHMPFHDQVGGHSSVTGDAPRLDYDFTIPAAVTDTWYVWLRGQCGGGFWTPAVSSCMVHWGIDRTPMGQTASDAFGDIRSDDGSFAGSNGNLWIWERVGSVALSPGIHQVNIWGGGPGSRLDKIVLTRNPEGPSSTGDRSPGFIQNTTPSWDDARNQEYQTYVDSGYYGGPPDTRGRNATFVPGRPSFACHQCNPIYGLALNQDPECDVGTVIDPDTNCEPGYACCSDLNGNGVIDDDEKCDNSDDDLFDDKQPIRAAQEAAKNFVRRMRARSDQGGFVEYSTDAFVRRELNCLETPGRGLDRMPDGPGLWDPVDGPDNAWIWCYDHRRGPGGYTGDPAIDTVRGSILFAIESMEPEGSTNIADGLKKGIQVLGTQIGHYGRQCAVSVIVLMTDEQANQYPAGDVCSDPEYADLWPEGGAAEDCAIYYANQARDNNVIVYTVGLGDSADLALLAAVAERTGGMFYFTPRMSDLDRVLQEIADQVHTLAPGLQVGQWATPTVVQPGKQLTFTLAVTNTGTVNLHATITDTLPTHVTPTGFITWTPIITTPGGVWTQTVAVTVGMDHVGPLTNVVEVTTQECVTSAHTLILRPGLEITKWSVPDRVLPGGQLTYTLRVTNTGSSDLHATVTDTLPAHVTPTGVLTWTRTITAPGGVWTGQFTVTLDKEYAGPLTNVVRITTREGTKGVYTETAVVEPWWLYLPLVVRQSP
jgi:uncharacterized repeat protein (TIGR01451 family)